MTGLPGGWVEVELGETILPLETCDPTKEGHATFRYVDIGSIDNKTYSIMTPKTLVGREAPSRARRRIRHGDVLFSTVRTYLKNIAVVPKELDGEVTSTGIAVLRPSAAILSDFLFAMVRSEGFIRPLSLKQDGTLYPAVTDSDLLNHQIALPPLGEQKRIVAKLNALSAVSTRARADLSRIETLVSRYKQTVLSKAFSGELTGGWRDGEDWPDPVRLEKVAGSFDYGSAAKSQKAGAVPVLRMGNIQQGRLDWTDLVYANDEKEISKFRLKRGDVLFNRTNSPALVGKTAMFDGKRDAIFAGYLIRIVAGPLLRPEYLTYALNSPAGRAFSWNAKTDGVSQSNISATKLKEFSFCVPSLEEQHEIVRRIESAFVRIDQLAMETKRALKMLGSLDEAILAKAFAGRLVPQDERDEPASVLLQRVKQARVKLTKVSIKPTKRRLKAPDMAQTIAETLKEAKDWLNTQELFARCGVRDGASTEDVEELYRQFLELERQEKVDIEEVIDPSTGDKQGNRVRLRK